MIFILEINLSNKVALVTGAKKGIGKAAAKKLALADCTVVVNDISDPENTVKEINDKGGEAIGIKADVSDFEEVKDMITNITKKYGKIDILVNNAGIRHPIPFDELTPEEWDRVIRNDLNSVYNCSKSVFPIMKRNNYGK
ncbi:MAG: SDR family NAD(P)-dependent oxidoreductase, partial [Halanaerobiales bacterium]